ncbi:GAF domain-containing protein [Dyadobacter sp. CY261]|uniref:GAF domain-containing protein n=1 Tax=Dyadobacter sp. CY261 TaxID=2907203 RepID=UPI001F3BE8E9|nr:GAF domain-containing protein [Dyadobacter sp. CY261]MCF0070195.1 GAF domain-containing protein [Dyadobacter sp. CY261]
MKNEVLDVTGMRALPVDLDTALSLMPYVRFLEQRIVEEKTLKSGFYKNILNYFRENQLPEGDIPLEEAKQYSEFFEYVYGTLSAPLASEHKLAWGLSFPLYPFIFYGTDLLFEMLNTKPLDAQFELQKKPDDYQRDRLHLIYTLILQRLYNFQVPVKIQQYHTWTDINTGLLRYYEVLVNPEFVEVSAKTELPELNFVEIYAHFSEEDGHLQLQKVLPLEMFRFRGFAVITVTDVTARMAVETIKKVQFNRIPGDSPARYHRIIQSLKTLVQNNRIEFDLFPFVRVNGQAVYGYGQAGTGVLFQIWGENRLTPEEFRRQAEGYAAKPNSFFSPDIQGEDEKQISWLTPFRNLNVRSLALVPLFVEQKLVGVLCMHTWEDERFDEKKLAWIEMAFTPIAQLLNTYIEEFNMELESIIKEKFTSIQPAVQWKFNEAAWHYLHRRKKGLPEVSENIAFYDVFPLYGAIDIRNSTSERNTAIRADLGHYLDMLDELLNALTPFDRSSLMRELRFHCSKWLQTVKQGELNSTSENNLNTFLNEEARNYLMHLSQQDPRTTLLIDEYLGFTHAGQGEVHRNRQELDRSMELINSAVNHYFEDEKETLQESYPCYFEKFRTDGIEYDIYIGQSIAPDKPFSHFHLKNLRLWQLSSMIEVARLTRRLLAEMPKELHTTQLIFVHNHMIDISFRADERKFDVEGAYNIRYQMIKKRIDKVRIKHSEERLTQPDKIALIYLHHRDIEDYLPFIHYLQETNALDPVTEELELEDLQGLSGLRALRLAINYQEAE